MTDIPYAIQKSINKYKPIEIDGLTLYPITVNEYEAFLIARQGVEVMQQALPINLVSLPLLEALYKLDYDAATDGRETTGLFTRALLFLALALRLGRGREIEERLKGFQLICDSHNPSKLKAVRFTLNGEEIHEITPVQFARYRPILAAQNGIELADDDTNPELVEAEQEIKSQNSVKLKVCFEDTVSTVAMFSHVDETEIYDWTILQFDRRRNAISRLVDYVVNGINEGAGCKWKDGNPVPSMWFDKAKSGLGALQKMDEKSISAVAQTTGDAQEIEQNPQINQRSE